jgi:hypothetical protein
MTLRKKLAEFGFESNDDYDFAVRCWLDADAANGTRGSLRAAELVGTVLRRKTAFAHALGQALEIPHRLYLDFSSNRKESEIVPALSQDEALDTGDKRAAQPLTALERVITEACAFSESARTLLILDQLHLCEFAEQLRIFQFLQTASWQDRAGEVRAHRRNMLVVLISAEPLYHSLQRCCFRIFTDAASGLLDFRPEDFGLGTNTLPLIEHCLALFRALPCEPTRGEFEQLLRDLEMRVRTIEQLRVCLFGRIENLARERLQDAAITPHLDAVLQALTQVLGVEEVLY